MTAVWLEHDRWLRSMLLERVKRLKQYPYGSWDEGETTSEYQACVGVEDVLDVIANYAAPKGVQKVAGQSAGSGAPRASDVRLWFERNCRRFRDVGTAVVEWRVFDSQIEELFAALSLSSPIEPTFPSWICNNCGRLEAGGAGKPTICGTCGWNNWKQHDSSVPAATQEQPAGSVTMNVEHVQYPETGEHKISVKPEKPEPVGSGATTTMRKAALSEIPGWMLNDGITEMEVEVPGSPRKVGEDGALATYLLNTSPPDWEYDKVISMAAESLSLSSPIEPSPMKGEHCTGAFPCPMHPHLSGGHPVVSGVYEIAQASSEVREAKIKTAQQCLYLVQAHGDRAMGQIKNYIRELEASRQGAGGK